MQQPFTAVLMCTIATVLCGCMPVRNSSADISNSERDVTVVLGLKNAYRVAMIAGAAADGEFKPNREGYAANIRADNGYVVAQLPERSGRYAITQVQIRAGGESFGDCEWKQALTFGAKGGKVVYLGDLDFHVNGKQLTLELGNNIEGARLFVDSNYPGLKGLVEYEEPRLMPHAKSNCDGRRNYAHRITFLPRR